MGGADPRREPALVFLRPAQRVCPGTTLPRLPWFRRTSGRLLSWAVVKLDGSPYSHSALSNGTHLIDIRLRAIAMDRSPIAATTGLRIAEGRPDTEDRIAAAYAWLDRRLGERPPDTDVPPFTVGGMALLAMIVLMARRARWVSRPFGRLLAGLVARDARGMFCSELIACAMVMTGAKLKVPVDGRRDVPWRRSEAVLRSLARRLEMCDELCGDGPRLAAPTTEERVTRLKGQLELMDARNRAFREGRLPLMEQHMVVGVDIPPFMVTPRDLFESPTFGDPAFEYGCPSPT